MVCHVLPHCFRMFADVLERFLRRQVYYLCLVCSQPLTLSSYVCLLVIAVLSRRPIWLWCNLGCSWIHAVWPLFRLHGRKNCPVEEKVIPHGPRTRFISWSGMATFQATSKLGLATNYSLQYRFPSVLLLLQQHLPLEFAHLSTTSFSHSSFFADWLA